MVRVGFIGMGSMGFPMAGHILRGGGDGDTLAINDMNKERQAPLLDDGAIWCDSAREVAEKSDVVVLMVPAVQHIEAVLFGESGLVAGAAESTVVAISSTISPVAVREVAARATTESEGRLTVIDTPVSGGEVGAKAGTLSIMVGGDDDAVALALPVLERTGRPVHLGPLGSGQVAKACNQLMCAASIAAVAEAAVVAERAGLDVAQLFELLQGGYAGSKILADKGPRYAAKDYSVSGAAWLWIKDLQAYLDEANATGTKSLFGDDLLRAFSELTDEGMGNEDTAVIQKWIAEQKA